MEKTYTVKEVSNILGYSTNSIYSFLKEKRIIGIRVGKGRFRISQSELNKILHLQKNEVPQLKVQNTPTIAMNEEQNTLPIQGEDIFEKHLENLRSSVPSLFDWFISLISIVTSLTVVTFVRNFEGQYGITLTQFLNPIKINLLLSGIGLFIINYLGKTKKGWYYIFYSLIILNFCAQAVILLLGKDLLGFFYYGITTIVILIHLILNLKGTVTFRVYIAILSIFYPLILVFYPSAVDLNIISSFTGISSNIVLYLLPILFIVINVINYFSEKTKNVFFWFGFLILCFNLAILSYIYSAKIYWNNSFVILLLIQFLLISTCWNDLEQNYKENRKIISNIFTDLLLVFVVIISIIWIIQNNNKNNIQQTLINRLVYGKSILENMLESSTDKIESFANNETLRNEIEKKDYLSIDKSSKDFFTYTTYFRRIIFADKDGEIRSIYPDANLVVKNVSFREYFKKVKSNKKTYISSVYETQVNGVKKQVVSINTPILDKENNFIGILIGSLDLDKISIRTQQIASQENNEYFILIDRDGNYIFVPENIILTGEEKINLTRGSNHSLNIKEAADNNNRLIEVHDKIEDTDWTIVIRRPLMNIYNFDTTTNIFLNSIFLLSGIAIIILNFIHLNR